jgi:hypothetical protein
VANEGRKNKQLAPTSTCTKSTSVSSTTITEQNRYISAHSTQKIKISWPWWFARRCRFVFLPFVNRAHQLANIELHKTYLHRSFKHTNPLGQSFAVKQGRSSSVPVTFDIVGTFWLCICHTNRLISIRHENESDRGFIGRLLMTSEHLHQKAAHDKAVERNSLLSLGRGTLLTYTQLVSRPRAAHR